jgi:metal-responsive CopG/Arc/MetJ family transcriptional regulator
MRTAKTISITLPPELLAKAQKTAEREDRTISELFREALRRYILADPEWDALLRRTSATGKALGVATESDVERLSDEFRQERLESAEGNRHERDRL